MKELPYSALNTILKNWMQSKVKMMIFRKIGRKILLMNFIMVLVKLFIFSFLEGQCLSFINILFL